MSPNFWIAVCDDTNAKKVEKNLIWGVKDRFKNKIKQAEVGDKLILYIIGSKIKNVYEIVSKPYVSSTPAIFSGGAFSHRVKLKLIKESSEIDFDQNLRKKLSFIENKRYWSGYFRRAMFKIPKEDFDLIFSFL